MRKPGKMVPFVLGMLTEKPATVLYPFGPATTQPGSRGMIKFHQQNCIGCKLCMKDCPANAIEITRVEGVEEKVFQAQIYLDRCIFCAQCVDSCRKDALEITTEFELAGFNRKDLKVNI